MLGDELASCAHNSEFGTPVCGFIAPTFVIDQTVLPLSFS